MKRRIAPAHARRRHILVLRLGPFLLRRGWRLMRAERTIVARQTSLGAHPCAKREALGRLAAAAAGRHRTPAARA